MKRRSFITFAALLALVPAGAAWTAEATRPGQAGAYDPENTGRNVRDRAGTNPTADQQSNDKGDVAITQAIRRAVVDDKSLSTSAHNVKIVTVDGVVTLRGPVASATEKTTIAAKAHQVAGVKRVDNQLEIATR